MNDPKSASSERSMSGGRLLYVVDDEPMLLELASAILAPRGYRIQTYSSPEAALDAFELADPKPALIITDYAMHTMNGLELAAACRQIRQNQKILLVSGTVGSEVCEGAAVMPDLFLAKPYESKQLIEAVESILAG